MVVLEGLPHECTVKSSWDNMILDSQQHSLQGALASYRHCWLYEGANPAFTATFLVIVLNYFPKSLGNPSLLTHFPGLWAFLKMAVSSKVLQAGCPCVSRSLCHTCTHMCTHARAHTHTHTHTHMGVGGEGCSAWWGQQPMFYKLQPMAQCLS